MLGISLGTGNPGESFKVTKYILKIAEKALLQK